LERLGGAGPAETIGAKIGSQLFTAAGPAAVETALKRGFAVFLDLKYHDIPNTVAGAVREATRIGVAMLNVHAGGGGAMMRAAAEAATKAAKDFGVARPICLGVTVLTSLDRKGLEEVGVTGNVEAHVLRLAERAREVGLDGCVASPQEIRLLRRALGPRWTIGAPGHPGRSSSTGRLARRPRRLDQRDRIGQRAANGLHAHLRLGEYHEVADAAGGEEHRPVVGREQRGGERRPSHTGGARLQLAAERGGQRRQRIDLHAAGQLG